MAFKHGVLVSYLYYVGVFLSVFRFSYSRKNLVNPVVESSMSKFVYGLFVSFILIFISPVSILKTYNAMETTYFMEDFEMLRNAVTLFFVLEYLMASSLVLMIFFNNQKVVNLVNAALELQEIINVAPTKLRDSNLFAFVATKMIFSELFSVVMMEEILRPVIWNVEFDAIMHIFMLFFLQILVVFVSNLFILTAFYASFLFQCLNSRINDINKKMSQSVNSMMSNQEMLELSDEIDKLAILHSKLGKFVQDLNNLLSIHNTWLFLMSFEIIVSQVSVRKCSKLLASSIIVCCSYSSQR